MWFNPTFNKNTFRILLINILLCTTNLIKFLTETSLKLAGVWRNGFNSEKPKLNKKIIQLTHSELDIKHKKSLNKKM